MSQRLDGEDVVVDDEQDNAGQQGTPDPAGAGTADSNDAPTSDPDKDAAIERMKAADRAKSAAEQRTRELEQRLREYEDKDKTELEKAQRDAQEAAEARDAAQAALQRERINNAFLVSNTYAWHNPERALSLLDLSEVTISEDGKVNGLDKAIAALAKSDPYLIKASDEDTKGSDLPPSGTPTGSGGKSNGKGSADRQSLMDKYPALRR